MSEKRIDFNFKELYNNIAAKEREGLTEWKDVMVIVEEFPEINYVLAYRGGTFEPWCVGYDYDKENNSWWHGNYFPTISGAMRYIQEKLDAKEGRICYCRMSEIASKAIDGLFEDDAYEAKIYCEEELELTEEENEYFGISEKEEEDNDYEF